MVTVDRSNRLRRPAASGKKSTLQKVVDAFVQRNVVYTKTGLEALVKEEEALRGVLDVIMQFSHDAAEQNIIQKEERYGFFGWKEVVRVKFIVTIGNFELARCMSDYTLILGPHVGIVGGITAAALLGAMIGLRLWTRTPGPPDPALLQAVPLDPHALPSAPDADIPQGPPQGPDPPPPSAPNADLIDEIARTLYAMRDTTDGRITWGRFVGAALRGTNINSPLFNGKRCSLAMENKIIQRYCNRESVPINNLMSHLKGSAVATAYARGALITEIPRDHKDLMHRMARMLLGVEPSDATTSRGGNVSTAKVAKVAILAGAALHTGKDAIQNASALHQWATKTKSGEPDFGQKVMDTAANYPNVEKKQRWSDLVGITTPEAVNVPLTNVISALFESYALPKKTKLYPRFAHAKEWFDTVKGIVPDWLSNLCFALLYVYPLSISALGLVWLALSKKNGANTDDANADAFVTAFEIVMTAADLPVFEPLPAPPLLIKGPTPPLRIKGPTPSASFPHTRLTTQIDPHETRRKWQDLLDNREEAQQNRSNIIRTIMEKIWKKTDALERVRRSIWKKMVLDAKTAINIREIPEKDKQKVYRELVQDIHTSVDDYVNGASKLSHVLLGGAVPLKPLTPWTDRDISKVLGFRKLIELESKEVIEDVRSTVVDGLQDVQSNLPILLPVGWNQEIQNGTTDTYFYYTTDFDEIQFKRPTDPIDPLPEGWYAAISGNGKIYYCNYETNEVRWDDPRVEEAAASP